MCVGFANAKAISIFSKHISGYAIYNDQRVALCRFVFPDLLSVFFFFMCCDASIVVTVFNNCPTVLPVVL